MLRGNMLGVYLGIFVGKGFVSYEVDKKRFYQWVKDNK